MNFHKFFVLILILMVTVVKSKTVFRRTDKFGENFKKVELPPEEIDPNVAPAVTQKIPTIVPETLSQNVIIEEAVTAIPLEVINEDANDNVETITPTINQTFTTDKPIVETTTQTIEDVQSNLSRYCKCAESHCDCCREFRLPLLPIVRGPACARVSFLDNDKMTVSLKYSDLTLATRTISGKRARPICVGLPGGYSQFCGRVYGLARSKDNFKACLGFELRADDEVEAALRVSCFKFGPSGLRVAESEPLPSEIEEDDDDDIFGFGAGGDDEDDEDDYDEEADDNDEADDDVDSDDDLAPVDPDYGGFSFGNLLDELDDDDDDAKKKPTSTVLTAAVPAAASTRQVELKDDKGSAVDLTQNSIVLDSLQNSTNLTKNKTKKKKSANNSENDFAYEILTGILEFFN